jgi:anaerobic magnesium-protoporphyrin IX monomethyl ester cyclase
MKVLFTHSFFLHFDPKQDNTNTPYPPLATIYAAALIRNNNYQVDLFDVQFCESANEIESKIISFKPDVLVIYDDGFNYLTKMCLTNMREAAWEMQAIAKKYNCKVIVSSSDATDHAMDYLSKGADIIIAGEAEQTLLDVLDTYKNELLLNKVAGIKYLQNSEIIETSNRQVIRELDALPKPAWDLIDIEKYKTRWLKHHGYFSLNFVTTRGCPYKCNWCAKPIYGNRYNAHSPTYIVELIKDTQSKFGFDHIWFADDIFGLKPNWVKEFNELLKKEKISIKYKIQSRADLLMEEDTIKHLKESGCDTVWMGAESGSQKILDAMDKGITVEQIVESCKKLKAAQIKPALFIQFGYLDETMEDIAATIKMIKQTMPEDIGISVSYPLPGTGFYEKVKSELIQKSNWSDSDDLDLMFKNNYSKKFYKDLHRYVHYTYRTAQSKQLAKSVSLKKGNIKRIAALPHYLLSAKKFRNKIISYQSDAKKIL